MTEMTPLQAWEWINATEARAEKAERQVAAAEALAQKWEATPFAQRHARALRAALAHAATKETP